MYVQKLHFKIGFSTDIIADYFSFFELSEGFQWAHARWLCLSPCHSLCYSGLRLTALGQNSIIFYGNQPEGRGIREAKETVRRGFMKKS
jgi:hypothetical protein